MAGWSPIRPFLFDRASRKRGAEGGETHSVQFRRIADAISSCLCEGHKAAFTSTYRH